MHLRRPLRRLSSATFAGVGTQSTSPVLRMVSNELLAGVGTLVADVTIAGAATVWQATALYAGVGTLTALNLKQWMAASYAIYWCRHICRTRPDCGCAFQKRLTGAGTLDATATFLLRPRATFAGAGSLVSSAGIFRPMFATYAGAGTSYRLPRCCGARSRPMLAQVHLRLRHGCVWPRMRRIYWRQHIRITPILRMRAATTAFTGAGLMSVNMLQFGKGILIEALLAGASTLTAIANMQIVSAAQFAAEGAMTVRYHKVCRSGTVRIWYRIADCRYAIGNGSAADCILAPDT